MSPRVKNRWPANGRDRLPQGSRPNRQPATGRHLAPLPALLRGTVEAGRQRGKARKQRRERVLSLFGGGCSVILENGERCFVHGGSLIEIHHVDGDPSNDSPNNLVPVCKPHHRDYAGQPRSAFVDLPMPLIG